MNQEHYDLLKQGTDTWNSWRAAHPDILPDLNDANLSSANLSSANLISANLGSANLGSADLSSADLSGAYLSGARLRDANLNGADLSRTDLNGADLRDANLSGANLSGADLGFADLNGANLTNTNLWNTVFAYNDLSTVKGLTQINHHAQSYISLNTVKLPQDGSALHFLRGAGIPDEWIDFYRTTMMKPIQYHSCFISYSSSDEQLARRLHADLQDQGVRCWFAPEDMKIGDKLRPKINEMIHVQDKLLLILSAHSVKSEWVAYEVKTALIREKKQQREILFPIRIDDAVFQSTTSWSSDIQKERHIGDFRQWTDHEHYQKGFERLLRDLKQQA